MSVRNWLSRAVLLPLSDQVFGRSINSKLNFLEKSQWWSLDQLEEYQNKRLRVLIHHAYHHVPYYRQIFDERKLVPADIQTKADLIKLPILSKSEFKANFPNGMTALNLKKGTYTKAASSGSTGEPIQYLLSKEAYSMNIAAGLRAWSWMGFKLGDKYVKISQNQRKTAEKRLQDLVMNDHYVYLKNIEQEGLLETISALQKIQPKVLRCYPDPLEFLADLILDRKLDVHLNAIASTGSNLHESARKKMEEAFHCKVFDGYSCEGSAPYFQCEQNELYHGAMEYGIAEFVDVEEIETGVFRGKHIATNLWNFASPFIRYDSQDVLEWTNEPCSCGRQSHTVKRILGRENDILVCRNGKKLIVQLFVIYFSKIKAIDQFQIIQHSFDNIDFLFRVNKKYTNEIEEEIRAYWTNLIDDSSLKISIRLVDEILPTKSGKRRFVINKMKP